jgi:hypothetical protein
MKWTLVIQAEVYDSAGARIGYRPVRVDVKVGCADNAVKKLAKVLEKLAETENG